MEDAEPNAAAPTIQQANSSRKKMFDLLISYFADNYYVFLMSSF